MGKMIRLTVYFEDPFWVGVFQRTDGEIFGVYRYVFGSEPTDKEVYEFIRENFLNIRFTFGLLAEGDREKSSRPKKMRKKVSKELNKQSVGTKAQIELKKQREERKRGKAVKYKQKKEMKDEIKYERKKRKKKEKHRGH